MKPPDNATLVADLRHASSVVRDFFFGAHSREIQNEWMNQLETMLETAADRIDAIRNLLDDHTWPRENVPEVLLEVNAALTYEVNLATSFGAKVERNAILRFLRSQSRLFESACDMDFVFEKIKNGVPGAPNRGVPSERWMQELRLFRARTKVADEMFKNARRYASCSEAFRVAVDDASREPSREAVVRTTRRAATLKARMNTIDRVAKEWGLE